MTRRVRLVLDEAESRRIREILAAEPLAPWSARLGPIIALAAAMALVLVVLFLLLLL